MDTHGTYAAYGAYMAHIYGKHSTNSDCTAHCTENEIGNRLNGDGLSQSKNQRHSV